jgi:hypothetical protein
MADNAIYTPTPKTIRVLVYRDRDTGEVRADGDPTAAHLIRGEVIRTETAPVVGRGNLHTNGRERWYQVELSDGTRHMVLGDGS